MGVLIDWLVAENNVATAKRAEAAKKAEAARKAKSSDQMVSTNKFKSIIDIEICNTLIHIIY